MSPGLPASGALAAPRAGLVTLAGQQLPLTSVKLEARAEGGLARSLLVQEYENPHDEALEVLYTMPLPADGSVIGYTVHLGEQVVRGEVQSRDEARETYHRALEAGRMASLIEEDRADTFQQQLGNLPPHARARVEIEVLHRLAFVVGTDAAAAVWEYRFPTVVGVRYEGEPGRVRDAERLDVDRADAGGTGVQLTLDLQIADDFEDTGAVVSPSHRVVVTATEHGLLHARSSGDRLDRDVVLRWPATQAGVGVRLVTGGGLEGDGGRYGLLTITPPERVEHSASRDVTVLLDASGSMSGEPIGCAKRLIRRVLETLQPADRFEVLVFASDVERLHRELVPATLQHVQEAIARLDRVDAGGCTEMVEAMVEALRPLRDGSQRQVLLFSDGEIGFEDEVIAAARDGLQPGVRIHAIGVGGSPNRTLLAGLARAAGGVEVLVTVDDDLAKAADVLLAATDRPVLTDVTVSGAVVAGCAPAQPIDVLAGRPALILLELAPSGGVMRIEGALAGEAGSWSREIRLPVAEGPPSCPLPLGALYGREAILDLETGAVETERPDLAWRIASLGLRHRIPSSQTSLVAVLEEPVVDPKEPRRRHRLPVEMPRGVSAEGVGYYVMPGTTGLGSLERCSRGSGPPEEYIACSPSPSFALDESDWEPMYDQADAEDLDTGAYRELHADLAGEPPPASRDEDWLRRTTARFTRRRNRLLVMEVDTQDLVWFLPGREETIEVRLPGGEVVEARIDVRRTTRQGEIPPGRTFRLALRMPRSVQKGTFVISWDCKGRSHRLLVTVP